jgi:hypothetical protein
LRNFYTDAPLKFDSDGKLTSNANPGFGPTDGRVFVHQVQLTPNKLILIGTRPLYIFNRTKVIWEVRDTGRSVSIDILLPPENQPILRFRASSTQYS